MQKKSLTRIMFVGSLLIVVGAALTVHPHMTAAKTTNFVTGGVGYFDIGTGQYANAQLAVSGSFTSDGLLGDMQHNSFSSYEADGNWFTLDLQLARMATTDQGATAWFAGQVTDTNDATILGKWYFVRVYDGGRGSDAQDTIYVRPVGLNLSWPYSQGSFAVSLNMVVAGNMTGFSTPITSGNIQIH